MNTKTSKYENMEIAQIYMLKNIKIKMNMSKNSKNLKN